MPLMPVAVHAYSECRDTWAQLDPADQAELLNLALQVWDTPEGVIEDQTSLGDFSGLLCKGVVVQDNGRWRFAQPHMLLFVQSINLFDASSLSSQTPYTMLQGFSELLGIAGPPSRGFSDYLDLISFVIVRLVNEFARSDLIELVVSEEISDHRFWQYYEPVRRALPVLEMSIESFAKVLMGLAHRVRGDIAGGWAYEATEQMGSLRPQFALELVDYLAGVDDQERIGFLERLLTGIAGVSSTHFDQAIARSEAWIDSSDEHLCQAAVYWFQNLILAGKLAPDQLLLRFDSLVAKPMDGVRYALSSAIVLIGTSLGEYAEESLGLLKRLKDIGPLDQVAHGIATTLSRRSDEVSLGFRMSCLSLLTDVPVTNKGTIKAIDWALYCLSHSRPGEVWRYLEEWVLAHELEESIIEHALFLRAIQYAYEQDPNLGKLVLTRWFTAPDLRLVEEARSVLRELRINNFDASQVELMSAQTIVYLTEKLVVGRFPGPQMLQLCCSILWHTSQIEKLKDYFLRTLWYLAWSYPGSTKELFEQVIGSRETARAVHLVRKTYEKLEQYFEQRKGTLVAELAPSKRRTEKYHELECKQMQLAQEAMMDDDRFPLQKLVSHVTIARGDRSFHMNVFHPDPTERRTFDEPRGFGRFSESIELPRGEFLDPEGEAWRRAQRLRCTPDDVQERNT